MADNVFYDKYSVVSPYFRSASIKTRDSEVRPIYARASRISNDEFPVGTSLRKSVERERNSRLEI